jgi:peptidoglycan hydrolase-like protein with peptidoglycan-binding domain
VTSLASYASQQLIREGDSGQDVTTLQTALESAGYRIVADGIFGDYTTAVVQKFQAAHGLVTDGVVGSITAALLDAPHGALIATAHPLPAISNNSDPRFAFPHDDTASMIAFYGDPSVNNAQWQAANLVPVIPPWPMVGGDSDDGETPVKDIYFHRKCAPNLLAAMNDIWTVCGKDHVKIQSYGLNIFSGAYNYRPIRGSSRLSEHAFAAAIDLDAPDNPMTSNLGVKYKMPQFAVDAFKARGAWWGGDYKQRKDYMHFGFAHE